MRFIILLFVAVLFFNGCMSNEQSPNDGCSVPECINGGNDDLSTAILCNNCLVKGFSRRYSTSLFYKFQQEINSIEKNGNDRKIFADLDADVLLLIFDQLSIESIIHLLDVSATHTILYAARATFWRRYKDYAMRVLSESESEHRSYFSINYNPNILGITTKEAPKILRYFGSVFRHLIVEQPSTIITKYINKYLSNSLTKFEILSVRDNDDTLYHITKPFTEVQEFKLTFDRYRFERPIQTGNLSLCQLFPNLRELSLYNFKTYDNSFIICEYPHLEHLTSIAQTETNERMLDEFLNINPQIQSMYAGCLTGNICGLIEKYVPNIENLTVSEFGKLENRTRLEHVKHLKVNNGDYFLGSYSNMYSFPRLESLQMSQCHEFFDKWSAFFREHTHVRKLTFLDLAGRDSEQFINLLNELPYLVELILIHKRHALWDAKLETVIEIINSHPQLEKVELLALSLRVNSFEQFKERFQNEWNIKIDHTPDYNTQDLWMEKKV